VHDRWWCGVCARLDLSMTPASYMMLSACKDEHCASGKRKVASISLKWYDRSVAPNLPRVRTRSDSLVIGHVSTRSHVSMNQIALEKAAP
jgi:hypothetical protein